MSVKTDQLAKIAEVKEKILALQQARADAVTAGGMPATDEAEVDAALAELSTIADPTVPNPPGVPPDPRIP